MWFAQNVYIVFVWLYVWCCRKFDCLEILTRRSYRTYDHSWCHRNERLVKDHKSLLEVSLQWESSSESVAHGASDCFCRNDYREKLTSNVENSALQIVFWRSDKQKFKEYFNKLAPSRNLFTDGKAKVSIDATKGGCGTQQESLTSCNAVCVEAYRACVKDTSYIKELMALALSFKLAFRASVGILQVDINLTIYHVYTWDMSKYPIYTACFTTLEKYKSNLYHVSLMGQVQVKLISTSI